MLFYQAKLVLCRFVTTKFLPLVEFAGKLNAAVTRDDCTIFQKFKNLSLQIVLQIFLKHAILKDCK
jgi:hypothetical protein